MADPTWTNEDEYWRGNYSSRPYARGLDYNTLGRGYRYGYDAATRYPSRAWSDLEPDLERGWATYEFRGESTWEQVKHAARDAWDRMTGRRTRTV